MRIALLIPIIAARLGAVPPCPCADVRLMVTDLLGDGVPITTLHFVGNGRDFAAKFQNGRAGLIPYGQYEITVLVSGFKLWHRDIQIRNANVILTVGMETGEIEVPPKFCSLNGRVTGLSIDSGSAPPWVRAQTVFGYESFSTELNGSRFRFENIPCGKYLMVVVSGADVIGTASTLVSWNHKFVKIALNGVGNQGNNGRSRR